MECRRPLVRYCLSSGSFSLAEREHGRRRNRIIKPALSLPQSRHHFFKLLKVVLFLSLSLSLSLASVRNEGNSIANGFPRLKTARRWRSVRRKREGLVIDGGHIKIMNGHIIASWQSGDVSRRVMYTRACVRVCTRARARAYIDAIAPVISSRPALSAISPADLALLEPLSELTQIRPRFLAPSPTVSGFLSLSLRREDVRSVARQVGEIPR